MTVKHYSSKEVSVIVGSSPLSGFADGDFCTVDRNEDAFELLVGADGEATRSLNSNKSGTVTIRLLASSASNDTLSELHQADQLSGRSTFGLMIRDNFGRSVYTAATAWVKKTPSAGFGKSAGTREWVIETDELIAYAGGN